MDKDTKTYLETVKKEISLDKIKNQLDKIKGLSVLIIGDTIIDHYIFTFPKGRAVKDPILSVEYLYEEKYPGGALAVANHVSNFAKSVKLVTLLGDKDSHLDFISQSLNKNITLKTFTKENSHTIVKKRYVDSKKQNKLFKIEYMNDRPISNALANEIADFIEQEALKYDIVMIADFGHGFLHPLLRNAIEKSAKFLALNVQSNSSNMGYNYFTNYNRFDFISMDESELRMPLFTRFEDVNEVIEKAGSRFFLNNPFLVTRGNQGCIFVNKGKKFAAPTLTANVKDTVGAGDAVFAIASLFIYAGAEDMMIPFIANSAGGIKVSYLGNKESVSSQALLDFVANIQKEG